MCDAEIEDDFSPEDTGPTYFAGPWTGCSVICGDGIKTREVEEHNSKRNLLPVPSPGDMLQKDGGGRDRGAGRGGVQWQEAGT